MEKKKKIAFMLPLPARLSDSGHIQSKIEGTTSGISIFLIGKSDLFWNA